MGVQFSPGALTKISSNVFRHHTSSLRPWRVKYGGQAGGEMRSDYFENGARNGLMVFRKECARVTLIKLTIVDSCGIIIKLL